MLKEDRTATSHIMLQSAMEYLMTYGWAILIIAVVLGALYSLGVFNMSAFMPKIGPGACHVFRPNGPGSSWNVALTGSCAGYLPQYVTQFNGQSSYVSMNPMSQTNGATGGTMSAWIYIISLTHASAIFSADAANPQVLQIYIYSDKRIEADFGNGNWIVAVVTPVYSGITDKWLHVVATWSSGSGVNIYVNGIAQSPLAYIVGSPSSAGSLISIPSGAIGCLIPPQYYFNGLISNVQIYNTSLTANQIQYLYNEGIGGAPIYLQHLMGWWPLNGDTNDYSGNNNNGVPAGIAYNGSWTSGYFH